MLLDTLMVCSQIYVYYDFGMFCVLININLHCISWCVSQCCCFNSNRINLWKIFAKDHTTLQGDNLLPGSRKNHVWLKGKDGSDCDALVHFSANSSKSSLLCMRGPWFLQRPSAKMPTLIRCLETIISVWRAQTLSFFGCMLQSNIDSCLSQNRKLFDRNV